MATNSVNNQGLAPQFVAAETIRTLVPVLVPLRKIAVTDFGSYVARIGQVVHTRLASPFTAGNYDPATGFVAQAATSTDIAVSLDNLTYVDVGFTDQEQNAISAEMLKRVFLAPLTNAVTKSIFDSILAGTTASNFSVAAYSGSKAAFDRSKIAEVVTSMTSANLPYEERAGLISPAAYGQLLKDPTISQYLSIGSTEPVRDGRIGSIHGLELFEYNGFPASGTAFTEGLNGLVSCKEGWVIATRVTNAPLTGGGVQETIVEPDSGFALAFRQYYNWQEGKMHLNMSFVNGIAKGNGAGLQRIAFTS
jgi:hypothetical protein